MKWGEEAPVIAQFRVNDRLFSFLFQSVLCFRYVRDFPCRCVSNKAVPST